MKFLFVYLLILSSLSAGGSYQEYIGSYTGVFKALEYKSGKKPMYENKITIFLDKIDSRQVKGRSVVAGNYRPFTGAITFIQPKSIGIEAAEPGDDKYDGVFHISIEKSAADKKPFLEGTWKANDTNLSVTKRYYQLYKFTFVYQAQLKLPEDVIWEGLYGTWKEDSSIAESLTSDVSKYNPSVQLLSTSQVENMYKGDLEVLRNSIYARHGYSFKNRKIRYVFDSYVEWYTPYTTDVRNLLTPLEKSNEKLLKRYEDHAKAYYDSFGR